MHGEMHGTFLFCSVYIVISIKGNFYEIMILILCHLYRLTLHMFSCALLNSWYVLDGLQDNHGELQSGDGQHGLRYV